jgi:signal transduction histidine kinase
MRVTARACWDGVVAGMRGVYRGEVTSAAGRLADVVHRPGPADALLAGVLLVLVEVNGLAKHEPRSPAVWIPAALAVPAIVPLAWRRRAPLVVLVVTGAATLAAMIYHGSPGLAAIGPLVALYTVAITSPRRVSLGAAIVGLVGVTAGVAASNFGRLSWEAYLLGWALVAAAWLIGDNLRVRRSYIAELEAKAARAEADRAAETERAAAEERARIARELHDVVVHHVSVIAVQAGAARMLADRGTRAADAQLALTEVEATARQALGELRQLLGVLRHDGEPPTRDPAPGLEQLGRLLGDVRRAGLTVQSRTEGTPVGLPPAIDVSAYRIVQESLTNVLKHAGRVPASVVIGYGAQDLRIEVTNDGPSGHLPASTGGPGHGLAGMRERVAMFGGDLDAGPCPGGGFTITARIPLGGADQ